MLRLVLIRLHTCLQSCISNLFHTILAVRQKDISINHPPSASPLASELRSTPRSDCIALTILHLLRLQVCIMVSRAVGKRAMKYILKLASCFAIISTFALDDPFLCALALPDFAA